MKADFNFTTNCYMTLRSPTKHENFPISIGAPRLVIPAQTGIQLLLSLRPWIPAFAGMTDRSLLFAIKASHLKRGQRGRAETKQWDSV